MHTKIHIYLCRKIPLMLLGILLSLTGITQSGFPYTYADNIMYYPKLTYRTQRIEAIKQGLTKSLAQVVQVYDVKTASTINAKDIKSFTVFDDRIEIDLKSKKKDNIIWLYAAIDDSTMIFFGKQNAGTFIFLPGVANFGFANFDAAQQLADNIYALQYPVINRLRDSILLSFRTKVKSFRNTNRIATPTDAQQKLFERADSISEQDDYFEAIRLYLRAVSMDEMAYPTAYANLALLYAHINYFDYAIMYMKSYLMLEIDVEKQRGALDKLYEWEGIIYY